MKLPTITYHPPNGGTAVEFSEDTDAPYHLTLNYDGFAAMPVSHKTVVSPGQHGATCYDSLANPRPITVEIIIQSATIAEQKALVTALATAVNPLVGTGVLEYVSEDGTTYIIYCRSNGGPTLSTAVSGRTQTSQLATLSFLAHDPFFYSGSPHLLTLAPAAATFFPFSFPFTFPSSTLSDVATNAGSFQAPVTITFNGPVTNPVLTRTVLENGVSVTRTFSLTITLLADEQIVITTGKGTENCTYIDSSAVEHLGEPYVDLTSEYWLLEPGDNTIALTYDTAGSQTNLCQIQWSDKFVGVG